MENYGPKPSRVSCEALHEIKLTGGFGSDAFEDIVDERVEDRHGLIGDTGIRVYLLKNWKSRIRARQCQVNKSVPL